MHNRNGAEKCARLTGAMSHYRMLHLCLLVSMLSTAFTFTSVPAKGLPLGGSTKWEIEELEAVITFLLFDPKDSLVTVPKGLRVIPLRDVPAPEFEAHLKQHPEHADWAFSFVEFVRPKSWVLDGRALSLKDTSGIGVWFAPVDHSKLGAEVPRDKYDSILAPSPDALLVLGLWIPDREFADYMRSRGHHAEFGEVTLVKDSSGSYHGQIRLPELTVMGSATPSGEVSAEPDPFTQIFFEPGLTVEQVVIIAGANARERDCEAKWSKQGNHPLARGIFLGPTFLNVEGPINGSAYRIIEGEVSSPRK